MPIASQTMIDPLKAFTAGAFVAGTPRPCPLVATRFDVTIDAGLAVVAMTRTFRNAEPDSIEATITFPLPVHAALFALQARIGERVLTARAARKAAARERYEDALERGKAAVLHEEVLRGVHMLSVAQIAPGAEVEVRATWAITLTHLNGRGRLRIPLTVGDIYGRSALADSDDLIHGAPVALGALTVTCRDGVAALIGGRLEDGRAEVALNAPIDLDVTGWTPRELAGRMAGGRTVALRIAPDAGGEAALDAALLVDRSGSMSEMCSVLDGLTKHEAALAAIERLAGDIGGADAIDLWEFAAKLKHVGSTRNAHLRDLARTLDGPDGGTEIGHAIAGVLAATTARDILLVTDGKSHALDVQALARTGRRFAIVLVGADSLEAHVGHLAALTGGEIFVSAGPDLPAMLAAAARSLRAPWRPAQFDQHAMRERRAGMQLAATWSEGAPAAGERTIEQRAVAAIAASLMLATLGADAAGELAEAEGLVTHLTSLILVDEAGAAQEGIPLTRKVALPSPVAAPAPMHSLFASVERRRTGLGQALREMGPGSAGVAMPAPRAPMDEAYERYAAESPRAHPPAPDGEDATKDAPKRTMLRRLLGGWKDEARRAPAAAAPSGLAALAARVDWDAVPRRLVNGELAGLDQALTDAIRRLAAEPLVIERARAAGLDPVRFVIGVLAATAAGRRAGRIAHAILGGPAAAGLIAEIDRVMRAW
jgi:hypothetical protein